MAMRVRINGIKGKVTSVICGVGIASGMIACGQTAAPSDEAAIFAKADVTSPQTDGVVPVGCPTPINVGAYVDHIYDGTYLNSNNPDAEKFVERLSRVLSDRYGATCEARMSREVTTDGDTIERRVWVDQLYRDRGSWSRTPSATQIINIFYKGESVFKDYAVAITNSAFGSTYTYYKYTYSDLSSGKLREQVSAYNTCRTSSSSPIRVSTNIYNGRMPDYFYLGARKANSDMYSFKVVDSGPGTMTREVRVVHGSQSVVLAKQKLVTVATQVQPPYAGQGNGQLLSFFDARLSAAEMTDAGHMNAASYYLLRSETITGDGMLGRTVSQYEVERRRCEGSLNQVDGLPCAGPTTLIQVFDAIAPTTPGNFAGCGEVFKRAQSLASCGGEASGFCLEQIQPASQLPPAASGAAWSPTSIENPYLDLHTRF